MMRTSGTPNVRGTTILSARQVTEEAMHIAASLCVYTNDRIAVEEL